MKIDINLEFTLNLFRIHAYIIGKKNNKIKI